VIPLLVGAGVSLSVALFAMPGLIHVLRRRQIGQFIQEDIKGHAHKQGIPTMGGLVMVVAVVMGWFLSHLRVWTPAAGFGWRWESIHPGGLLAVLALVGMGLVGFLDDYIKVTRRRSLGLRKRTKFGGQLIIAAAFAWGANAAGLTTQVSFVRPLGIDLGVFFVVWVLLMLSGAANGVNFADGMDGLAAGSAALVVGAYTIITFWQNRNGMVYPASLDPLELSVISAAMFGALLGFLWWNAPPARIIMGDVGANAVGGLLAAVALLSSTHLLLVVLGGIFVAEVLSVVLQVGSYRMFGRRIFRMAPFHFHFDLRGWPETTVVIRFWILTAVGVALGLGLFYADFLAVEGILE
jgi:phospho-N-acetylmuramoyl-pentapeptide-transferase